MDSSMYTHTVSSTHYERYVAATDFESAIYEKL